MAVPKEIRDVERPKNTIVYAYGKNKDRYAVKQRIGCKYKDGRRIPVTGPTIGHIIDFTYVPIEADQPVTVSQADIDLKDWANIMLCDKLFNNIMSELCRQYNKDDAMKLYCISILRVCYPGIKDFELKEAYENSFLSELYPGVALSKNTVSVFQNNLGKTYSRIVDFMKERVKSVEVDHHLLVDGTLKSNDSKVNSLSDYSRKAKLKGSRDISVLYAFDLELMEPICSKCYPGNMLDVTAYKDFLQTHSIKKGIVVGDKGFPSSAAKDYFDEHDDLHYINPIKRNSKYAKTHNMYNFTNVLEGYEGITYRKEKVEGKNKWLYSFRDQALAAQEEREWLKNAKKKNNYSLEELRKKQSVFGTIIIESDLDLDASVIYKAYMKRWEIELVMRYYKSACKFDETRVQDDASVIGSEFIDFLSTVLTYRLLNKFDKVELLNDICYKKIMNLLDRAKKVRLDGEWHLIKVNPSLEKILIGLDLLPKPDEAPKKKRGRPRKNTV